MALLLGEEVALHRDTTYSTLAASGQVLFGIVMDPAGPIKVQWQNGQYSDALVATELDKILGLSGSTQQVVTFNDATDGIDSPEYQGVVVRRYSRQREGAGATVVYVLIKLLSSGEYLEVLASAIREVSGR
jgi:hypothetical protein